MMAHVSSVLMIKTCSRILRKANTQAQILRTLKTSKSSKFHLNGKERKYFSVHNVGILQDNSSDDLFNAKRDLIQKSTLNRAGSFSTQADSVQNAASYLDAKDKDTHDILVKDMIVHTDFITEEEEAFLLNEVDRYMKKLRYEFDHWDNAIHGYRETEKKSWNEGNKKILQRVKDLAFTSDVKPLAYVHVLDIAKEGYIKPHVDAVRFCGDTIAGICLLSSCVMRLAREDDSSKYGDIYLPQRSLYIMKARARFEYTHEILKEDESFFKGQVVPRDRRISVICRNEPNPTNEN